MSDSDDSSDDGSRVADEGGGRKQKADKIKEKNMRMLQAQRVRRDRDQRRRKYQENIRVDMERQAQEDAVKHTIRILPFSPVRDSIDPRVYEINRYTYQRSPKKTQEYLRPKLPPEFWDEEQKIEDEEVKCDI